MFRRVSILVAATAVQIIVFSLAAAAMPASHDGLWTRLDKTTLRPPAADRAPLPREYEAFGLDPDLMRELLRQAPDSGAAAKPVEIVLPLPDGSLARFEVERSLVVEPGLLSKFPELGATYSGRGIDDPTATVRLDFLSDRFQAMILGAGGTIYVDPYAREDLSNYISYLKDDAVKSVDFKCDVTEAMSETADWAFDPNRRDAGDIVFGAAARPEISSGAEIRTFRLALAANNEYCTAVGGNTVAGCLAAQVPILNRVNGVYEREVAIRFVLVANNNLIVYAGNNTSCNGACTAANDPYNNEDAFDQTEENQTNVDAVIGPANYDVGHVFSTVGGGVGQFNGPCDPTKKAKGATGLPNPVGDPFAIDFVAHELGHQFGAFHTWNGVGSGSCGAGGRSTVAAYEPGSGITIMAYAGICSSLNISLNSIDVFHVKSIEQIISHRDGTGSCAPATSTGNTPPTVSVVGGSSYTIPRLTPFTLTASGSDPNGDSLTYMWQQYDLGPSNPPFNDADGQARPLFRPFLPTTGPARTFPALTHILNNQNTPPTTVGGLVVAEALPSMARTMNFQVVARDNRASGGGVNTAAATVNVTASGPFRVTAPNSNVNYAVNSTQTVTWDVADTAAAPVNAANVKISLSIDGGISFPTILAASTANDGSEQVTVPGTLTNAARIKIEAVGNIFFDISNANFTISATGPTPSPSPTPTIPPSPTPTPQDGDTDPDFVSRLIGGVSEGTGTQYSTIRDVVLQPDGKAIVVGEFISFASRLQRGIARINADGTPDYAFHPRVNGDILAVALQPDHKIIIAGSFTEVSGQTRLRVARLNTDGTLDTSFQDPAVNTTVSELALQNDNIVIGGAFASVAGTPMRALARLTPTGGRDPSFTSPLFVTETVGTIIVDPLGRLYIGGSMQLGPRGTGFARLNDNGTFDTSFTGDVGSGVNHAVRLPNGQFLVGGVISGGIKRVDADGNEDTSFLVSGISVSVQDFVVQSDNKIVAAGFVSGSGNSTNARALVRLSQNGEFDASYIPNIESGDVFALAIQPNDKVFAGGNLARVGGQTRNSIVRLNMNGSLDLLPEDISLGSTSSSYGIVQAILTQADGKILIGGYFTSAAGVTRRAVARLNQNGTIDSSFQDPGITQFFYSSVSSLAIQPADGKILVGGDFELVNGAPRRHIIRLHPNGALDTSFSTNVDDEVTAITVQPLDGKIMIGGRFGMVGGQPHSRMARLNPDGSLDASFNRGSQFCMPYSIDVLPDGKMHACGSAGFGQTGLVRYNPNGSIDNTFTVADLGAGSVSRSFRTPEGKFIIIGSFSAVAGGPRSSIARLNANGTLDTSFGEVAFDFSTGGYVLDAAVEPNGKVVIVGNFRNVNGQMRRSIARLNADGTVDPNFIALTAAETTAGPDTVMRVWRQQDGRILVGGDFESINRVGADYIARLYNGFTPGCSYSASPPDRTFTAAAGTSSFSVVSGNGCDWTASSSASWLNLTSGSNGTGSGTVNYSVAANTTGAPRTATIDFGGVAGTASHTVTQQSGNATPTPSPTPTVAPTPTPTVAPSPTPTVGPTPPGVILIYPGPPVSIPDNLPAGVNIVVNVAQACTVTDLNFTIQGTANADPLSTTVGVNHSWVGDLAFRLTSPAGTSVSMIDRPGVPASANGCNSNNLASVTLDDDGGFAPIENQCGPGDNAAFPSGQFAPNSPLSAFDGQSATGNWTLNVSDSAASDIGSLRSFTISITCASVPTPTPTPATPTPTPVTPTPTPVTPTPTPTTPTPTPTVAPSPTASPSPTPTATPIVRDGSYERTLTNGTNPDWTSTSTNFGSSLCVGTVCGTNLPPRTGTGWVWFDGATSGATPEQGSASQSVNMPPAGSTATLRFYMRVASVAAPSASTMTVTIDGTVVQTFTEPAAAEAGYVLRTVDLSAFANGQARTLSFNYSRPGGAAGSDSFLLDDVELQASTGQATATITGRVTTPTGTNLRNVVVTVINQEGVRVNATTSSFGVFTFPSVPTGQMYTMTVSSRRYRFAPKTINNLTGNVTGFDFVGLE